MAALSGFSISRTKSPLVPRPGKRDFELMFLQPIGIELADRLVGFILGAHGDVGISHGSACVPVRADIDCRDISSLCKEAG